MAANVIDLLILSLVIGALGAGPFDVHGQSVRSELQRVVLGLFIVYGVLVSILFARGTTPGKRVLGLYVIKEDGQRAGFGKMLYREWVLKTIEGLSGLILLVLSGVMMFIDRNRQSLHDKAAHTYVVGMSR